VGILLQPLSSSIDSLTLPPMDKRDRKLVHEVGNALNLRSKSTGSGDRRFPTLFRTALTLSVTDSSFARVEARLSRRFRSAANTQGRYATGGPRATGRVSIAAVSYRDGDVVGAEAPEIGNENRGRAMLEKMGWTSGTALGAMNNKGILQPVSHTVKNSKLGLG
jgi:G-patch domain/R3H domain